MPSVGDCGISTKSYYRRNRKEGREGGREEEDLLSLYKMIWETLQDYANFC